MFTETVKTHIKTLRKKIDPEKKIIQTVRGKGYVTK
jgi:DNA-binding response OmpR family regulator